jgi:hypothetical protein
MEFLFEKIFLQWVLIAVAFLQIFFEIWKFKKTLIASLLLCAGLQASVLLLDSNNQRDQKQQENKLRKDLEQSQIKIQELSPRTITKDQRIYLIEGLKKIGQHKVVFYASMGDFEAFQFAEKLKEVFSEAGWQVEGIDRVETTTPVAGIQFWSTARYHPDYFWLTFDLINKHLGATTNHSTTPLREGFITILIGSNPSLQQ